jgi:small redox-active disulfide protein 2
LLANVQSAVRELGLDCHVEHVTDVQRIAQSGVLTTPALVVDGQVKLTGQSASVQAIKSLLK